MPPKQRKIAIMGYRSVGKSSLTLQFVEGQFVDSYDPTIENKVVLNDLQISKSDQYGLVKTSASLKVSNHLSVQAFTKSIRIDSQEYEVKLVDTAGQDEYSIFPAQYSMDIHGYVLVYSITSSKSFEVIQVIYDKLLDMTGKVNVPIVLVGNKTDLHMERMISSDEGKKLADSWKASFLETSAKQNESVADIFHTLLVEIERANGNVQRKNNCVVS